MGWQNIVVQGSNGVVGKNSERESVGGDVELVSMWRKMRRVEVEIGK